MTEQEVNALSVEHEAMKRISFGRVMARRKAALRVVMDNLAKDIDALPPTAQDVAAVYMEIVSKLYNEFMNISG